jgi:hypothetical protein
VKHIGKCGRLGRLSQKAMFIGINYNREDQTHKAMITDDKEHAGALQYRARMVQS